MTAQVTHITLKLVRSLKRGELQRFADTEVPGFQVWVGKKSISYFLRKRSKNKEYAILLGHFPEMLPEEARAVAIAKLAELAGRFTVAGNNIINASKNPHLKEVFDYYIKKLTKANSINSARFALKHLEFMYSKGVYDLTPEDMEAVHKKHKDTPVMANAIIKTAGVAIRTYLKDKDMPAHEVTKSITLYQAKPRKRYLTNEEMDKFFKGIEYLKTNTRYGMIADIFLVLLYTGARKTNVAEMCIEEINENNVWIIPKEKYKANREHSIALGEDELAIIRKYAAGRKKGLVFQHTGSLNTRLETAKKILCNHIGLEDFTIHDLRRTLGTWMLNSGVPIEFVSKKLGHSSTKITETVYAHLMPEVSVEVTDKIIRKMKKNNNKEV